MSIFRNNYDGLQKLLIPLQYKCIKNPFNFMAQQILDEFYRLFGKKEN